MEHISKALERTFPDLFAGLHDQHPSLVPDGVTVDGHPKLLLPGRTEAIDFIVHWEPTHHWVARCTPSGQRTMQQEVAVEHAPMLVPALILPGMRLVAYGYDLVDLAAQVRDLVENSWHVECPEIRFTLVRGKH